MGTVLVELSGTLARCQYQLVQAAAEFAESAEWLLAGSPTAASWLAGVADVEESTAREWIRIGRCLGELPVIAEAFKNRELSYSKVRTLTRVVTRENEVELAALAKGVAASELATEIAAWMNRNLPAQDIADYQRRQRMVKWRHGPDGMITFTLRLEPHIAAVLISLLTTLVMRSKARKEPDGIYPGTVAQYADAVEELLTDRSGQIDTEVIFHVRGDGATTDDGTPVADTVMADLVDGAYLRALIHDGERRPINASGRHRHPTSRQKRVVKERDRVCVDCRRRDLHEYDHYPDYAHSQRTVVGELQLRCVPCHHQRHHPRDVQASSVSSHFSA
ncbi:MAG: DUF222 domain-containing protein [Actinomycetia bacterium]|nr:DUF222 domain-containing protein [Actinomycetes bacterium]